MSKNKVSRDEALRRLEGVLVGSGPVRVRLTDFGRARHDKVVDQMRLAARDALGIEIEVASPESEVAASSTDVTSVSPFAGQSGALATEPPASSDDIEGVGDSV